MTKRRAFWFAVLGAWTYGAIELQLWRREQRSPRLG